MPETILVVAEQREGKLNPASLETIAAAGRIANETGRVVEVVLPGVRTATPAARLAQTNVAKVYSLEAPALASYTADAYTEALKHFITEHRPALVLFPHTYQARDFAPQLAVALDCALISDCTGFKYESGGLLFTRQMFQGKLAADVSFRSEPPWLATFQIGAYRADEAEPGSAPIETVSAIVTTPSRVTPHEVFQEAKRSVDLTQAGIIVAVGRGIREEKNIAVAKELAEALGGEIAASRPICDNGWLPIDRQVGSSGQTVAPKLYFAVGISGAIQHLVGMKGSRAVVAVNKDRGAPIFEVADVGLVGDLFDIVPAVAEAVRKAKLNP